MAEQEQGEQGYRVRWTERSSGLQEGQWCGSWLGAQLVARRLQGSTSITDLHITDARGVTRFAVLAEQGEQGEQQEEQGDG